MILAKLKEYADTQMSLPPEMYKRTNVRWYINISPDGDFDGLTSLGDEGKGIELETPYIGSRSGAAIRPVLLVDTAEYCLGVVRKKEGKPEQVKKMHAGFKKLINDCYRETKEDTLGIVLRFLELWKPSNAPESLDGSQVVAFRVGNILPFENPAIQKFWGQYTSKSDGPKMMCLVTGEVGVVEQRIPGKILGIPRKSKGEPARKSLVSAQGTAFCSYGLENSLTSPISRDAAERFMKGLNDLLAKPESRFYVGSLVYVFWTKQPSSLNFGSLLSRPTPEQVKQLFSSPYSGEEAYGLKANRFYALALSGSVARAVVRDWLETTIPTVENNLKQWFKGQTIVDAYGQPERYFRLNQLAEAAFRRSTTDRKFDATKEVPANVVQSLTHSAFTGSRLSDDLLTRLVRRCQIGTEIKKDQRDHVTHVQAALLKLILATQGVDMPENPDPKPPLQNPQDQAAYQCGRLLAELDATQRAALGQRNATVVDRFYGAASSTPSSAFAPLLTGLRAHLSKLRKTKPGTWQAKEEVIEEILDYFRNEHHAVPKLPSTLTIQQQGIFALGFYHQRAENRAKAKQASEDAKKLANQPSQGAQP